MNIHPLTPLFGAEITNINLSNELDATTIAALQELFLKYSVLIIRDQHLSQAQFVRVSQGFGALEPYDSTIKEFLDKDYPEIIVISNIEKNGKSIGVKDAGQYWHTDRSYVSHPAWSSLLYSIDIPIGPDHLARGDTQYSSTTAAFMALPNETRNYLRELEAVHKYAYRYTEAPENPLPEVTHPVVFKHPYTGCESLYVNKGFTERIVGMQDEESKKLLDDLFRHITQPQFIYTHKWRVGDIVMWDNFATQHKATSDYELPMERLMWRTTVKAPASHVK